MAERQTAARGRRRRAWHSPPGGLWMSVILPGPGPAMDPGAGLLPLLVGLAAARGVEGVAAGVGVGIKWPNDLVIGELKLGGVLCEGFPGGAVAGIGINVREDVLAEAPDAVRRRAVCLEGVGPSVAPGELAGAVLGALRPVLERRPLRLDGYLLQELAARDALRGREVSVEDGRGRRRGRALGIEADGALLLERGGEVERVVAGSVRPLGASVGAGDP